MLCSCSYMCTIYKDRNTGFKRKECWSPINCKHRWDLSRNANLSKQHVPHINIYNTLTHINLSDKPSSHSYSILRNTDFVAWN